MKKKCKSDTDSKYMSFLNNKIDRKELMAQAKQDQKPRRIISFYRYVDIENPLELRNELYRVWRKRSVLGRIYVSHEGINAQLSILKSDWDHFLKSMREFEILENIFINESSDSGAAYAFFKLDIRVRKEIVVHKLKENPLQISTPGEHLSPRHFHDLVGQEDVIVVDARNGYESDIGHFENAVLPTATTFSKMLPELKETLSPHKNKKILMYCTGGIRCETASAYLKNEGFENVFQLFGGITNYLRNIKKEDLPSKYRGSLFVFDERLAERTEEESLGKCYQCGAPHPVHSNCGYVHCHGLMIQCPSCKEKFQGCCSKECIEKRELKAQNKSHLHEVRS